ncbi:hypothetical protein MLD38_035555 [Melastoma candidum]|uniref:Uncharacterized protein n=1 Tax=Melastoma candidum TaxID=119954 RepID=A0ACB9LGZ3_9MYRT|nr:hypothetical protein MLD38_035555 [Melastoma candidum]
MSKPWVLVFLFLIIVFASQFEWKQQLGNEVDHKPSSPSREQIDRREKVVKEKIILSQERDLQKLKELVRTLRQQLRICRGDDTNATTRMPFDQILREMHRMASLED